MPRPAEPLLPALNGLTWLPGVASWAHGCAESALMPRPAEPLLQGMNGLAGLPRRRHGHIDVLNRLTCGQAVLGSCAGAS